MARNRRTPEETVGTGDIVVTGVPVSAGGSGQVIQDTRPNGFWASVMHVSGGAYSFVRIDDGDTSYPELEDTPDTGDGTDLAAYEINGSTTVATDSKVWLEPNRFGDGFTFAAPGGTGDVVGPGSATDNAIARFDGTTGKLIQNSAFTISDAGVMENGSGFDYLSLKNSELRIGNRYFLKENRVTLSSGVADSTAAPTLTFYSDIVSAETISLYLASGAWFAQVMNSRYFVLRGSSTGSGTYDDVCYAIDRISGTKYGVNATLPDGSVVTGGIVTTAGTGTFLTQGTADGLYQPLDADLTAIAALGGTNTIYYRSAANTWSAVTIGSNLSFSGGTLSATGGGVTDHGALTGLSDDDHSQYALLAGRSNQQLYGSTGSGGSLGLIGTSHATKGPVSIEGDSWFQLGELSAAPSTAANYVCLYALTSDGHLYAKTDDGNARRLTLPVELGTVTTGTWNATAIGAGYGGTGQTTYTIGDFLYATGSTALSKLAPNTGGTKQFLSMTSSAPSWGALAASDVPTMVAAGASGAGGATPTPGTTARTNQPRLLADNATWIQHSGRSLGTSSVATSETTTSVSPVDLTTAQSITFTLDDACDVLIYASCAASSSSAGGIPIIYADVNGTDTEINRGTSTNAGNQQSVSGFLFASLSTGSNTIKLQFGVSAGTGTFVRRRIGVIKLT